MNPPLSHLTELTIPGGEATAKNPDFIKAQGDLRRYATGLPKEQDNPYPGPFSDALIAYTEALWRYEDTVDLAILGGMLTGGSDGSADMTTELLGAWGRSISMTGRRDEVAKLLIIEMSEEGKLRDRLQFADIQEDYRIENGVLLVRKGFRVWSTTESYPLFLKAIVNGLTDLSRQETYDQKLHPSVTIKQIKNLENKQFIMMRTLFPEEYQYIPEEKIHSAVGMMKGIERQLQKKTDGIRTDNEGIDSIKRRLEEARHRYYEIYGFLAFAEMLHGIPDQVGTETIKLWRLWRKNSDLNGIKTSRFDLASTLSADISPASHLSRSVKYSNKVLASTNIPKGKPFQITRNGVLVVNAEFVNKFLITDKSNTEKVDISLETLIDAVVDRYRKTMGNHLEVAEIDKITKHVKSIIWPEKYPRVG